jgi:site-specific DNA-methyltransferase (cytosine-N4-specific)
VHALIDQWCLGETDHIVDPFVGAGTTILAAKERCVPAVGYDLSPLAVLASQTKLQHFNATALRRTVKRIKDKTDSQRVYIPKRRYPALVEKALSPRCLGFLEYVRDLIQGWDVQEEEKQFVSLGLLAVMPLFSRAVATGGWLRWRGRALRGDLVAARLFKVLGDMISDVESCRLSQAKRWSVEIADARHLPERLPEYTAAITSPPYPNRHDYTRVFGVELMFAFYDSEGVRALRCQSLHSHPEARPIRSNAGGYECPAGLLGALRRLREKHADPRVIRMLDGYFVDLYLCLRELARVCKPKANIALVVGNAQYSGEPILVDELCAEVGEQAGLRVDRLMVTRYRGNSAQQMGLYGRRGSRETVVVFQNPVQRPTLL